MIQAELGEILAGAPGPPAPTPSAGHEPLVAALAARNVAASRWSGTSRPRGNWIVGLRLGRLKT